MLAGIMAMELFLAGRARDFTTVTAEDWRLAARAAETEAAGRDILCLGDSLIKYGVFPRVIEARTGLTSYNLALNSGPMPAEYFLLRRALAAGARPRAIVADFFPLMIPDQPRGPVRVYAALASWADGLDLARTTGDGDLATSLLLHKLVPSVRCRFEVRQALMAAFAGKAASARSKTRPMEVTWRREQGAQPMAPTPPGRSAANPALVADLTPGCWTVDRINSAYFERFVALAEAHGVPIFWVIPPLGPEIEMGRDILGTGAAYSKFARDAQAKHPGLTVLDARRAGYDGSSHIDPIHLNEGGAMVLSEDIAREVADHLAGRSVARWVDLPIYAGRGDGRSPNHEMATRARLTPR